MIEHSELYDAAITGASRRSCVRVTVDLVDPDLEILGITASSENEYSQTEQLGDRQTGEGPPLASLEPGVWVLDGSCELAPDDPEDLADMGQYGWISGAQCGADGAFDPPPYVEMELSGIEHLRAVTVVFPTAARLGVAADFTLAVYLTGDTEPTAVTEVTGNAANEYVWDTVQVEAPARIRLTVHRWSVPHRYARVLRLLPGLLAQWSGDLVCKADVYTEVTFSGLALPHSTCTLELLNADNRFDPYAPGSLFDALEARQPVKVEMGVRYDGGSEEFLPVGTYYQQSGGWSLSGQNMTWDLVDIIGLLKLRKFNEPAEPTELPVTLGGWISAIIALLGPRFEAHVEIDADTAALELTADGGSVYGKDCGELLRFACMATNTWPRQDVRTGKLLISPLEAPEGNRISLDNMNDFPTLEANDDVRDVTFVLDDGSVTYPGSAPQASDVSLRVDNPFIHTAEDAAKAYVSAMFEYGGRWIKVYHRGNPSSEPGDIQTLDTRFQTTVAARLYKQQLKIADGIMRNVPSFLVQSPMDEPGYTEKVILTGTGSWIVPEGVTRIRVTIIGGGTGGRGGGGGVTKCSSPFYGMEDTDGGTGGAGGLILIRTLSVTGGSSISYSCGAGGAGGRGGDGVDQMRGGVGNDGEFGGAGEPSTFGAYSSNNGVRYENGLADIKTGAVYAQPGPKYDGVTAGLYGCGGIGGRPGANGSLVGTSSSSHPGATVYEYGSYSTDGEPGGAGQPGCIIVEWTA